MLRNESSHVLTVKELSDYLKVHPSTIYRQLKRGRLPAFKVGSDWRFNIESIDRWRLEQDGIGAVGWGGWGRGAAVVRTPAGTSLGSLQPCASRPVQGGVARFEVGAAIAQR